jgi:hypothetical protein
MAIKNVQQNEKLGDEQLSISYEIKTDNFDLMEDFGANNRYNCSMQFEKYAIIYCEKEEFTYFENYMAIVKFDHFLKARNIFVKALVTEQPLKKIPYFHEYGNYLQYIDGNSDIFIEVEVYDS